MLSPLAPTVLAADSLPAHPAKRSAARLADLVRPLEIAAGALFTLAAVYLHVFQSRAAGGLWRDEANSIQLANMSWRQLWHDLEFDSYPALFLVLLRGWSALFSSGDASLRTLGLLIGLGVIACFWLGARALGVRVPLFALVLLGLNPMMIRYGDSVRAYGLGCALALLTLVAVWKLATAERPGWRRFALAAVAAVLSVQCLYHNAALLLATCLGGAAVASWRRRPVTAAAVLAVGVPAALSLLPYLPIIARTRSWSVLLKYPVTPAWLWDKLSEVTGSPDPLGVWLWGGLALLGGGLAVTALRRSAKTPDSPAAGSLAPLFAAFTLVAGGLIFGGFLIVVGYVTQPWYYLGFVSLAAVCLDAIFGQPSATPGWRVLRLAVVTAFAATTFGQSVEILRQRSTDADLVAAKLNANVAPGDLVLVNRWECAISLNRYYHGLARLMTVPPIDDHAVHRYDVFVRLMQTADPLRPVFDAVGATLRHGGRVWFVGYPRLLEPGAPPPRLPPFVPKPGRDWPFGSYNGGWEVEADEFLTSRALQMVPVNIPLDRPVSDFEDQNLLCFSGWRDDPQ